MGIDHSREAITHCCREHPGREFLNQDVSEGITGLSAVGRRFDAVTMCGFLFHAVDKSSLAQKSDIELAQRCLEELVTPQGYLVIIAPFAYRDHQDYSLFVQADWKLRSAMAVIGQLRAEIVHQTMALQIGLERAVAAQSQVPDWFLSADDGRCENRFSGHYLASWTIVLAPSKNHTVTVSQHPN